MLSGVQRSGMFDVRSSRSLHCHWFVWSCLLFGAVWTCGQTSATFVPPATIKIAFLCSFNLPNPNTIQFGEALVQIERHPGGYAFKLAIDEINNASAAWRDGGRIGPAPLLPETILEPLIYDTKSDSGLAVNLAVKAVNDGAITLVGEWLSGLTGLIEYIAAYNKVPHISPASVALEFTTQKSQYPYFMRLAPHIGIQSFQLVSLIKYLGWNHIAILFASDPNGAGGAQTTTAAANKLGVNILTSISFNIGDTDFSFQIQRLVASKAKIIVYWGLPGDLLNIWRAIKSGAASGANPDLISDSYQWILEHVDVTPSFWTDSKGQVIEDAKAMSAGAIGLNNYYDKTTPEYLALKSLWSSQPPWSVTSTIVPSAGPTTQGTFTYDTVKQVARGLDWMLQHELDPYEMGNRQTLLEAMRNRTWTGATGPISLDSFGDRKMGFGIVNYQRKAGTYKIIGQVDFDGNVNFFPGADPMEFMGSQPTLKPTDLPSKTLLTISESVSTSLIVVTSILLGVFTCVQVWLCYHRQSPAIKASSPIFLSGFIFGIQLLCASVYARVSEGTNTDSTMPCQSDLWLTNLGYTLLVGALFVKTMRLQVIFGSKSLQVRSQLNDRNLLIALGIGLVLESSLLLGLQYGAPIEVTRTSLNDDQDYWSCHTIHGSDNGLFTIHFPVNISTRFTLLLVTAVMAFYIRDLPDAFNESKQLLFTIYNLLFMSALLPIIDAVMGRGLQSSIVAYSICVFVICTLSVAIMIVPKVFQLKSDTRNSKQRGGLTKAGGDTIMGQSAPHRSHENQTDLNQSSSNSTQGKRLSVMVSGGKGNTTPTLISKSLAMSTITHGHLTSGKAGVAVPLPVTSHPAKIGSTTSILSPTANSCSPLLRTDDAWRTHAHPSQSSEPGQMDSTHGSPLSTPIDTAQPMAINKNTVMMEGVVDRSVPVNIHLSNELSGQESVTTTGAPTNEPTQQAGDDTMDKIDILMKN